MNSSRIFLLFAAAVFLCSCSRSVRIFLVNESKTDVQVEYRLETVAHSFSASPYVLQLKKGKKDISDASPIRQIAAADTLRMTLAPGEALEMAADAAFNIDDEDQRDALANELDYFQSRQQNEKLSCTGKNFVQLLKKTESGDYLIVWR